MVAAPPTLPDLNGLNPDELKALILAQHQNLVACRRVTISAGDASMSVCLFPSI